MKRCSSASLLLSLLLGLSAFPAHANDRGMPPPAMMSQPGPHDMAPGPMPGMPPVPAFLRGLRLSDEQQDRIFLILHQQQPALREAIKARRQAAMALHELSRSGEFQDGKAAALAQALGRADADIALLRARGLAQMLPLLTAEQRRQLTAAQERPRGGPGADRSDEGTAH